MAKVSICIPSYNNPTGIRRLLGSIKSQTFTDYEVILTDDSTDDQVELVTKEMEIPALFYYKNEKSLGAASNWNKAVSYAAGEYIKMMHHDDFFTGPDSLAQFVALLDENPEAVLAFSGTVQVEKDRQFSRCISDEQLALITQDFRNLFLGNYIGAPSATIYRKNKEEYDSRLSWLVDVEYYMRLLANGSFAYTTKPLISIGVSADQLTEKCRDDGALNMFEYGVVFKEFGLISEARFRQHLIQIGLKYKQSFEKLKEYGITEKEYKAAALRKKKEELKFLLGVVKRKFTGK